MRCSKATPPPKKGNRRNFALLDRRRRYAVMVRTTLSPIRTPLAAARIYYIVGKDSRKVRSEMRRPSGKGLLDRAAESGGWVISAVGDWTCNLT